MADMVKNLFAEHPVQTWSEFFEMDRFGKPDFSNLEHLTSRMTANWEYYSGNYLWILKGMALLAGIVNSNLLVYYAAFGAFYYFAFVTRTEPLKIGEHQLTWNQQSILLGIVGFAAIFYHGWVILQYLSYGLLFIIVHSAMRKRSVKSKVNYAFRANSSGSLTNSISKVADKIVNAGEELDLKESVKYDPNVYKSLRSRSSQYLK